jgi:hypothetical protein
MKVGSVVLTTSFGIQTNNNPVKASEFWHCKASWLKRQDIHS